MKTSTKPKVLDLKLFSWNKIDGTLSAEDSELRADGNDPFWYFEFDHVVKISIRSETTGVVERFYLKKKVIREGEIQAYEFSPINPDCRIKKVIIYND